MNKVKIGKEIKRNRVLLKLSQKELANKLHVSFQAVSKWERGLSLPDVTMLEKLCHLFEISLSHFLYKANASMEYNELINSLNKNGINSKNYLNLGSLIHTDLFDETFIRAIEDVNVKEALLKVQDNMGALRERSLISLSHHVASIYAKIKNIELNILETIKVNDIKIYLTEDNKEIDSVILSKTIQQFINDKTSTLLLTTSKQSKTLDIHLRCSLDLMEKGFNAMYITQIMMLSMLKQDKLSTGGGGGKENHARFSIALDSIKENSLSNAINLLKQYITKYQEEIVLSIN